MTPERELRELIATLRSDYERYGGDEMKLYEEMLKSGVPEDCPAAWGVIEGKKIAADKLEKLLTAATAPTHDESTLAHLEELHLFKEKFPGIEVQEYCQRRLTAIAEIFGTPAPTPAPLVSTEPHCVTCGSAIDGDSADTDFCSPHCRQTAHTRYRPNPLAVYRCPYCNQYGRLTDPGNVR